MPKQVSKPYVTHAMFVDKIYPVNLWFTCNRHHTECQCTAFTRLLMEEKRTRGREGVLDILEGLQRFNGATITKGESSKHKFPTYWHINIDAQKYSVETFIKQMGGTLV